MDKICFFQCFSLNCYRAVHVGDSSHKRMLAWCKCPLQSTSRLGGLHSAPGSGELGAEPGSGPGRCCRPEQNKNPGHMFTGLQLHHPATGRRHPTSRAPHHPRRGFHQRLSLKRWKLFLVPSSIHHRAEMRAADYGGNGDLDRSDTNSKYFYTIAQIF